MLIPGGVTLLPEEGEDAGKVQSVGARFSHGQITLEEAAEAMCRSLRESRRRLPVPGYGGHRAGSRRSARDVAAALRARALRAPDLGGHGAALGARGAIDWKPAGSPWATSSRDASVRNAMVTHAAFGGSTNLILHLPAIAFSAGLKRPTVDDWTHVNRQVPRLVDALPNGPKMHPTVQVFLAGGVPEVMLHLRRAGLLDTAALTVSGESLGAMLDWWEQSERRVALRRTLRERDGVDPGRRDHGPRARAPQRPDIHRDLPQGQPGARWRGDQEHVDRPERGGRRRRLPHDGSRPRLSQRAHGDCGHQARRDPRRAT